MGMCGLILDGNVSCKYSSLSRGQNLLFEGLWKKESFADISAAK
jgi:hypothetical protein